MHAYTNSHHLQFINGQATLPFNGLQTWKTGHDAYLHSPRHSYFATCWFVVCLQTKTCQYFKEHRSIMHV